MSRHTNDALKAGETPPGDFDRAAQLRHAQALTALSPQTLSRLRATRHTAGSPARRRHGLGWILAGGSAAVLALAVAVQLQRAPIDGPAPSQIAAIAPGSELQAPIATDDDYQSLVASLDENPDLYLWLAANHDALPLPLER